jgi:hypothetical protein
VLPSRRPRQSRDASQSIIRASSIIVVMIIMIIMMTVMTVIDDDHHYHLAARLAMSNHDRTAAVQARHDSQRTTIAFRN